MNIFEEIVNLQKQNQCFAAATIISSKGSTPRHTAKMIVKQDGSIIGTIGGGLAEVFVIEEAVKAIQQKQSKVVEYILNRDAQGGIQMFCGGALSVFIEVISPRPKLVIVGAGHVGMAVAKLAAVLEYQIIVVDDRQEFANQQLYPMAQEIYFDEDIVKALEQVLVDENTYIAIFTKDADERVLRKVIQSETAYIGMIGSKRKAVKILQQLQMEDIEEEKIQSVHTPIGLDIGAETPEEIAVSIIAEIMKVKNKAVGKSLKDKLWNAKDY